MKRIVSGILASVLTFAATAALAQSKPPLKLGGILDMSGLYADITGVGSETAAKMAAEDFGGEVLGRKIESYWAPRYGTIEHTPNAGIYGPKVMIINEFAGSGGDAMPWLFRHNQIGPLVGKRTWGGLVGIGQIPVLMDGGQVTSPSVAWNKSSSEQAGRAAMWANIRCR